MLVVALAVAALVWSVQYLRTQEDPTANAPAPKATPKETVPSNTPSPETSSSAEDVPANPEYGSPQWLQQLNSTLATLEAENLIEEDVADDLRDSVDDALDAYAEGDDKAVERELSHLDKELTKGFQEGDLPFDGPLGTLFNLDGSGDRGQDGDGNGDSGDGSDGGSDDGDGDGSGY